MTLSQRVTLATAMATTLFLASAAQLGAWEPNDDDLDKAIASANFTAYFENATAWLNEQAPAQADQAAWLELLEKPVFRSVLDQRQLIAKCGLNQLAAFAQADSASSPKEFLRWLLKNTAAMDLYLEGAVPLGWAARERNDYTLNTAALEIWKQILAVDPDAKEGLPLKLAIATALAPPGSGAPGAGHSKPAVDPVERYKHFKTAHRNKELVPSFDALSVWEYQKVVQSGASNEDLAWGRKMINDWRPDLLIDEMVVNSTSFVWRRNAPPQYYPFKGMRDVMAGGGKCGPRSSWSVFICQACGVPAIGVGQPAHACVAYKAANPQTEPQPGSAWKVGFGRGWQVSKLENMSGPEFLAAVEDRSRRAEFSQIEHLRWLAAALTPAEKAGPVLEIARGIQASRTAVKTDLTASLKAEEAEADPGAKAAAAQSAALQTNPTNPRASEPIEASGGVLHVAAAAFQKTGGEISWGGQSPHVLVHALAHNPKGEQMQQQIFFQQQMKSQWVDYSIQVPQAGTYWVVMTAACVNDSQKLEICVGNAVLATVAIPLTHGLFQETPPVELKLEKGLQTLRLQTSPTEHMRGIALRSFDLTLKK